VADQVGASVVARAALGPAWLALPAESLGDSDAGDAVDAVRRALAPRAVAVLDGGDRVPSPWPDVDAGVVAVMQRVKARFDPARIFRPGTYVGGL
jgi:glycolate oxidase FAD binding subunit